MLALQCGDFFLVVHPALTSLALTELKLKQEQILGVCKDLGLCDGDPEFQVTMGPDGVGIANIPLELGFALNIFLKIPTRILLRLKSFRCRDFPKLFKQSQKIDWNLFINGQMPRVKASARKSRLMMLRRIEDTVSDGIRKFFSEQVLEEHHGENLTVYVRLFDDSCTLSIDTSGLPLYKRHLAKKIGEAPIRETLAAALLLKLMSYQSYIPSESVSLVDPMLGSGTFFLEAKTFGLGATRNDYAFLHYPMLEEKHELYTQLMGHDLQTPLWQQSCLGYDRNEKMLKYAQQNLENLDGIELSRQDIFADLNGPVPKYSVLVCNPPYGKRIGFSDSPSQFFIKLIEAFVDKWKPSLLAIVVPEEIIRDKGFKVPANLSTLESFKFINGGLRVCWLVLAPSLH